MAESMYSLKIELLFRGMRRVLHLIRRQLQGIQQFDRFILVYIQFWYPYSLAVGFIPNDIAMIHHLQVHDDARLSSVGLRMLDRHSWYISPLLATHSNQVPTDVTAQLVAEMQQDRGSHLLTKLTDSLNGLRT